MTLNDTLNMPCREVYSVCPNVCTGFAYIIKLKPELLVRELLPYANLSDVLYFLMLYFNRYSQHPEHKKAKTVFYRDFVCGDNTETVTDQVILNQFVERAIEHEEYWYGED